MNNGLDKKVAAAMVARLRYVDLEHVASGADQRFLVVDRSGRRVEF